MAIFRLGLTSFYSIRFSLTTIWRPNLIAPWTQLKEENSIIYPILFLSTLSISCGGLISWFPPIRSSFYILPRYLKYIPLAIVLIGVIIGYYLSTNLKMSESSIKKRILSHYSLCSIWFLVPLSSQFILKWPIMTAHLNIKYVDQGWLESISGINTNKIIININNLVSTYRPKRPSIYLTTFIIIVTLSIIIQIF
jgi:hypothetical protein